MADTVALSGLFPLLRSRPRYRDLLDRVSSGSTSRLPLLDSAKPFVLAGLQRDVEKPLLVLTPEAPRARQLADQICVYLGDSARVAFFPETDALFYEQLGWDPALAQERLSGLRLLQGGGVLVASVRAALQRLWPPQAFGAAEREVAVGQRIDLERTLAEWIGLGYEPAASVTQPGELARRGGIVDVFPPSSPLPVRLELFDDEIDTIRLFDPSTQRSVERVDRVAVTPPRELPAAQAAVVAQSLAGLEYARARPEVASTWAHDLERLARGESFAGAEYYGAFGAPGTVADYLPAGGLLVFDEPGSLASAARDLSDQAEAVRDDLEKRGEIPLGLPRPYWTWDELSERLRPALSLDWESAPADDDTSLAADFQTPPVYGGKLKDALNEGQLAQQDQRRLVIVSQQAPRLAELLRERGLPAAALDRLETEPAIGSFTLVRGQLAEGWQLPELRTLVLSDAELFGWAKPRPRTRRRAAALGALLHDLTPGDFVVHQDHGIGRFEGLERRQFEGNEREYLIIEYANDDRLFVPADQADRVGRYVGPNGESPTLHRLGGADWARAKSKAKRAARDIAADLLDVYAAREVKPGHAFAPDTVWQQELEASFPYIETPDQLRALAEVKEDMERPKPMDRLLCGDVGYGKTEVALRAAFKAVNDGRQVAVLVPTTVLAQQHFNTFSQRLAAFPVKVEMLSRFRSDKEQREVIAGLQSGVIDICIGTHRLLSKDVKLHNLGLVIIDEEQRFGVEHKERLKRLRKEVDVLTLTATPIPRTLYLSLAGVRDVSNIETPPEERLPIKTYVSEYDDGLIREVILREVDRGGQVYFVHNRVQGIEQLANRLRRLVPEATFSVGHGQMPEEQLEHVMIEFAAGRSDVLVCTTIIESGLDIPNVNTIVINEADRFGMAQLYQLRGRVGRGANRAYAYMLFGRDKRLSPVAEKRLRTIFEATELGAGYRIALRDLELRGAGNLLGSEQSGHLAAVGFDMYCRMLSEAVRELQGKRVAQEPKPLTIDLPLTAHLPSAHVAQESDRLDFYRRLARAGSEDEVGQIGLELRDRFGPPPPPAANLLYLVQLKVSALKAGVESIATRDDLVVIILHAGIPASAATRLSKRFGSGITIGHTQIRLARSRLKGNWLAALQETLNTLAPAEPASARAG